MQKGAFCACFFFAVSAMDLFVHAEAFKLGVKRSSIKLPWEQEPLRSFFNKRSRLISPPVFAPLVRESEEPISLAKECFEGKVKWSKKTTGIPWPLAQDRALARVLECWRIIVMDNLQGSLVGQQIYRALQGDPEAKAIEQTISDALAGKSVATLRARASSLMDFGRWKKGITFDSFLLPISEEEAYLYVHELREHNAPRSKASRFVEALTFAHHMLGADVGEAMKSPRVRGAAVAPFVAPKKKVPLTARQVAMFEQLAISDCGQQGIFAGYVCMVLHMRLRWSDGQFCVHEPYTDLHQERGFLECQLYHHKTAGRQKLSRRLLPAACVIPGVSGQDWATPWLEHRQSHGLQAAQGVPTMPAPVSGGGWSMLPLEASQATSWLRELLKGFLPAPPLRDLGTHSLKATILSMMSKAGCSGDLRRLAGYHVDPQSRMALEYSRDAQAPVLHAVEGILLAIQHGFFDPDATRSRRWPRKGCNSLELVMAELSRLATEDGWYHSKNDGAMCELDTAEQSDGWNKVEFASDGYSPSLGGSDESDGQASISSISEPEDRPLFASPEHPHEQEDAETDLAAQIVGRDLAEDLEDRISDVVYRHVISGCCHIAKNGLFEESDGEAVILRCGKVASKNFEEIARAGNYFPYKCSRCFADD